MLSILGYNGSLDSPTFIPANIYAKTKNAYEGENLSLRCSIAGITTSKDQNLYLCKDGTGVSMRELGSSKHFTFILPNVTQEDSGHYSCVYSDRKINASAVKASGLTSVFIQIKSQPGTQSFFFLSLHYIYMFVPMTRWPS